MVTDTCYGSVWILATLEVTYRAFRANTVFVARMSLKFVMVVM